MATTQNLQIDYLVTNTANPEVVVNDALDDLDNAISSMFTHDMTFDGAYTLSTSSVTPEWRYAVIKITDSTSILTTGVNIYIPTYQKLYHVWNATAQALTFKRTTTAGVTVAPGKKAIIYCDGSTTFRFTADI